MSANELTYDALQSIILFIIKSYSMTMFNYGEEELELKIISKQGGYKLYYSPAYNVSVLSKLENKDSDNEKLSVYILPNTDGSQFIPHKIQASGR